MMKKITSAQQRRCQKTLKTHNKDLLKRTISAQQASIEKQHITSKHWKAPWTYNKETLSNKKVTKLN